MGYPIALAANCVVDRALKINQTPKPKNKEEAMKTKNKHGRTLKIKGDKTLLLGTVTSKMVSLPGYVYHCTGLGNFHNILKSKTMKPYPPKHHEWTPPEARIYWSSVASYLLDFAPDNDVPVMLRTKRTRHFKKDPNSETDIYATKQIPISQIQVLTTQGYTSLT